MMWTGVAILAQRGSAAGQILFWLAVLVAAAVALGLGALAIRRALLREDEPAAPVGFGLGELRRMRDAGQISEQEYENARRLIVARTRLSSEIEGSVGGANSDRAADSDKRMGNDPAA